MKKAAFLLIVFLLGTVLYAQNSPVPAGLEWEIVDGKSVTITRYTGTATTLNIPEQIQGLLVTAIGDRALSYCTRLFNVSIPSSVTVIGEMAFFYCSNLTNITVDNNNPAFVSVGGVLFDRPRRTIIAYPAGRRGTYDIPSSVTAIGDYALGCCHNLTGITIPSSVTYIGEAALSGCFELASITVDSNNPAFASIDDVLFDKSIRTLIVYPGGNQARTYVIPSSVTAIGDWAFYCGRLTNISIPPSLAAIGDDAFSVCSRLASVTIPSSVRSIGDRAFSYCSSLTSVTIPSSVTYIGEGPFSGCSSLTGITVDRLNLAYTSVDGVLFDKTKRTIINYPAGKQGPYVIPSSVTAIGEAAFSGCSSLTSVSIPSSVTTIGESAFSGCSSLISVSIPSSVTTIADFAFSQCSSLTSITIPSLVTAIGEGAFFYCDSLTDVTLSRRTQLGDMAFPATARISYSD
jgi:hypothetical protein